MIFMLTNCMASWLVIGTGLGLQTIRERLKLLHGEAGWLHIGANSPTGVIATIEVPYQLSK